MIPDEQTFTNAERLRYARHFSLDQVGSLGQKKLKSARVLAVGAGGLACPALQYLAAAGIGTLGVIDGDRVDLSNLQRQILFQTNDVGAPKVDVVNRQLTALNPHVQIITYDYPLDDANARDIIAQYDVVLDCSDNFPTRYLVNDACFHLRIPNVFACIYQFEGQASIFCAENGPCYRCLYETPPSSDSIPNCAEAGVLGVLPGLMGTIQATEAIKLILGVGDNLTGRVLAVDALSMNFREYRLSVNPDCSLCVHQTPFESLTRTTAACASESVPEMSASELKKLLDKNAVQLLDVREPFEYEICHIGEQLISLKELPNRIDELKLILQSDRPLVVYCKLGGRSRKAVQLLQAAGIKNVHSLKGGICEWIKTVEPSMTMY